MSRSILPQARPKMDRDEATSLLARSGVSFAKSPCAILAMRAYYRRTMGDPKGNDRGIYDDAIVLVTPSVFAAFNANTDPSIFRKHVATLCSGLWYYRVGTHGLSKPKAQRYTALVQAGPVRVSRDEEPAETGYFGINIHRGGRTTTSSLGCQTIWPGQWDSFIATVRSELSREGQSTIPYYLLDA